MKGGIVGELKVIRLELEFVTRHGLRYFFERSVKFDLSSLDESLFEEVALSSTRGKIGSIWKVKSKGRVFYTLCIDSYEENGRLYYLHRVFRDEECMVKFLISR